MIHLRSARINVAVRHCEPLLSIGIRVALQDVDAVRLLPLGDLQAEPSLHVLITDWDRGLTVAEADPRALSTRARVLVISSQVREQPLKSAMRHGVHGLLLSGCSTVELVAAIVALAEGRSYVCAEVAQRMAASLSREPLTAREEEVLALLSRGQCNKSIASRLGIATGTVKSHVKAILGKLAASSRTEAASIATELGMVEVANGSSSKLVDALPARRSLNRAEASALV
jgi:DNA-binding NarL/FixJ family response regulator